MEFMHEIENILFTSFKALPPLLLAGLGGMITYKIRVLNLGLEGMMLLGAFTAILTNYYSGSALLGLLAAVLVSLGVGFIFAVLNIKFKVNNILISVGINMFAAAFTSYLLSVLFKASGSFASPDIVRIPAVSIPFLARIPLIRAFNGLSIVFWITIAITVILWFVMKKTTWGLRIEATGLNAAAVSTAGINPDLIRYLCITLSGAFCGLGGAYLSTGYLSLFTSGMVAGRGFLGNIASVMGNRSVVGTCLGSLLFCLTDGATMKIQMLGFPSQLIQLIPYFAAFIFVIAGTLIRQRKNRVT